ncbi:hypothetical protein HK405_010945 [Cladochytrium tenue]|nr:hypothetical protein HK405_010945 [Cladochytrium tenue]
MSGATLLLCTLALLASGADAATAPTTNLQSCLTSTYDSTIDYFPEKLNQTSDSSDLTYTYSNSYKTIYNAIANETIVLYQCGTPKPNVTATRIISVPIANVSISDTTMVTYFELLGLRSSIKYSTGGVSYITSPCVQSAANTSSGILDVDSYNTTHALEQINSVSVSFGYYDTLTSEANNSVSFDASADPGVLHREKWLGFVATFFNLEATANSVGNTLLTNYQCLNSSARSLNTASPKVAFVAYSAPSQYNNNTASWSISASQYKKDYVSDAGGQFFIPGNVSTTVSYTSSSALLAAVSDVDILIDETYGGSDAATFYTNFGTSSSATYKFVQNKQIWMTDKTENANAGDDYYEAGIVEENVVLADFISVVQPKLLTAAAYNTTFLRNIFTSSSPTILSAACSNYSAPLALTVVSCPLKVSAAAPAASSVLALVVAAASAAVAMLL